MGSRLDAAIRDRTSTSSAIESTISSRIFESPSRKMGAYYFRPEEGRFATISSTHKVVDRCGRLPQGLISAVGISV